jgi:hypothetical protein
MKYFLKTIPFTLFILILGGCYYDRFDEFHPSTATGGCDTTVVMSFATHIVPILNTNCGTNNSCHGTTNTSYIDLSAYAGVHAIATNGKLVSCITWDGNASQMPQGSSNQISICDQTKIRKWVTAGAPNN